MKALPPALLSHLTEGTTTLAQVQAGGAAPPESADALIADLPQIDWSAALAAMGLAMVRGTGE